MKKKELKQELERLKRENSEMLQAMKEIIFKDSIKEKFKWGMIIQMNEQAERVVWSGEIVDNKNIEDSRFEGFSKYLND